MSDEKLEGGTGAPAVSFEQVSKNYGAVRAVRELTLHIPRGRAIAFLGPNGAGKSTSLEMLLGLRKVGSGRIEVFGKSPRQAMVAGHVGAMLQSGGLPQDVTVREVLELMSRLHPRPLAVDEVLRRANIADLADRKADKLSGGQTQRVRFAIAIAGDSDLIVLDEPTTGMDVENRQIFWTAMKAEAARGKTILFATHYLEEADQIADQVIVINKGRLLANGTSADIKAMAGFQRVSFRLPGISREALIDLPAAVTIDVVGDRVQIQTSDSDKTFYALIDQGLRPMDLEITALGLEQAFVAITERDNGDDDGKAEALTMEDAR
ncbi:ABC transporter ATP-binding protein [Actinospica durhamensis]|uniref:ABC transporter ATP-binding protein n=1 Tax=Actinospica durhamensis TaxID=1508375 RepID=A0A941IVG7_9ACTN|nr:ABC transporter ATP-binding protein [Actinospica durhamensis]MBR7837176.1 ABC transporter ATP-binding protein [Actinospica durhamensis]